MYGGVQGAGGDCGSRLGPLWSEVQLSHAPVLGSVVRSGRSYQENGGDLHRRGLCEFSEGTVIHLRLVPVPPQHQVLDRSDVLHLAEELVLYAFLHGASVVHQADGDAVGGF